MTAASRSLRIVPHAERWRGAVEALNARMEPHDGWGFFPDPVPAWLAPEAGSELYREYFVAVTDAGEARGGYVLKHERVAIGGRIEAAACVQGPYSEGQTDRRFAWVVFALIRDMVERQPLLFGWGLEGSKDRIVRLFGAAGWRSHATPTLSWMPGPDCGPAPAAEAEPVAGFGAWADDVWERAHPRYGFVPLRSRAALERLYPADNPRFRRFAIRTGGATAGWAVLGIRQFSGHPLFGSAKMGILWDYFAAPEDAAAAIGAIRQVLVRQQVHAALVSAAHAQWIEEFRAQGFHPLPQQRHLLVSRALAAALDPFETRAADAFLTFGDGESYTGSLGRAFFGAGA